jgi:predicted nuclease with TOPRIM domain
MDSEKKTPKEARRITLNFKNRDKDYAKLEQVLSELNDKNYGEVISILDLMMTAINKLSAKDLEQMKLSSLTAKEKIEQAVQQYNEKNAEKLGVDEYICRQLKL